MESMPCVQPKLVFFDFGGVLAEEGFFKGLARVAEDNGLEVKAFFETAVSLLFTTGYLTGQGREEAWWQALRQATGVRGQDHDLREEILSRFVLRPRMLAIVDRLRKKGVVVAVLSDQTNWLGELEARAPFFSRFDRVFNSYREGLHKRDKACYLNALAKMDERPEHALFIDDALRNTVLARETGMSAIHFQDLAGFEADLAGYFPWFEPAP